MAETMEREIIFGMLSSYRFYRDLRDIVCPWDPDRMQHRLDFSTPRYNTLYRAIDSFYRRFDRLTAPSPTLRLPCRVLHNTLVDWANKNAVPASIADELLAEILEEESFTDSLDYESLRALSDGPAFKDWLKARVLEQTVGHIQSQKGLGALTLDNLGEMLERAKTATAATTEENYYNAGNIIHGRRIISSCIPIPGFNKLNQAIGGGLYRGEGTMVAGCNGGGKTILCMQIAKGLALAGCNTMVYTTERRPHELLLRTIADELSIDITRLNTPGNLDRTIEHDLAYVPDDLWNNPTLATKLNSLYEVYNQHLLIVDWSKGQGYSVKSHLEADVANVERKGWVPAVILFDWIGGGIDALAQKDQLRLYYQEAADGLINHAKRTNKHVIAFAQFDKVKAENKDFVEMNMLSECKTMTNNQTNFIGITSLVDKNPREGQPLRRTKQFLCVSKSTHGPGGKIQVDAMFHFQRVKETIMTGGDA
jgi:hypothetical protein